MTDGSNAVAIGDNHDTWTRYIVRSGGVGVPAYDFESGRPV